MLYKSLKFFPVILLTLILDHMSLAYCQGTNGDEFTFVRLQYNSGGENYRYRNFFGTRWPSWTVDYPFAERNFMRGLKEFTSLNVAKEPVSLSVLDDEFFRYPFAYAVEVGFMSLSAKEAERLGEWLLRGGFLMVDDFHGPFEWRHFRDQMSIVLPDRPIMDIPIEHSLFHCYYDFDELIQIPGLGSWRRGRTFEKGGFQQHCMGIFDDDGRLMVLVIRNMDMGDAWEHTQDPTYPEEFSVEAYKLGINFVIYALTH